MNKYKLYIQKGTEIFTQEIDAENEKSIPEYFKKYFRGKLILITFNNQIVWEK